MFVMDQKRRITPLFSSCLTMEDLYDCQSMTTGKHYRERDSIIYVYRARECGVYSIMVLSHLQQFAEN